MKIISNFIFAKSLNNIQIFTKLKFSISKTSGKTFKNSILPKKPRKPRSPDETSCCARACKNCFLDPYFKKMEVYEKELEQWEKLVADLKLKHKSNSLNKT